MTEITYYIVYNKVRQKWFSSEKPRGWTSKTPKLYATEGHARRGAVALLEWYGKVDGDFDDLSNIIILPVTLTVDEEAPAESLSAWYEWEKKERKFRVSGLGDFFYHRLRKK